VDWYKTVFELIDLRSFSNLWYWIALAVLWSSASHWVMGVPFDMISRARRNGGQTAADVETLVRINVDRLLYISRTSGLWVIGLTCFLLAGLATLGFGYGIEFARAVLFLLAPMSLVAILTLRVAARIEADLEAEQAFDLYRRLSRHRITVQVIGMVSIFVTAMYGMYQNMQINQAF